MNAQLKSCLLLLDNLLNHPTKYARQEFKKKLEEEELSSSDSSVTRILQKIQNDYGIKIKQLKDQYEIIEEESDPHYKDKYQSLLSLQFRQIIQKNILENSVVAQYISFGNNTQNKGIEFIDEVLKAIVDKRQLAITYQAFYEPQPRRYIVNPLFIREYQNRWYVIIEPIKEKEHPTFAFDRIQKLEVLNKTYKIKETSKKQFDNTIGITFSDKVEKVVLWFNAWQANYIKTLPLHQSQEIIQEDKNGITIALKVNVNFELEQMIKSYGSAIKVIEPAYLKQQVLNDFKKSIQQYEKE